MRKLNVQKVTAVLKQEIYTDVLTGSANRRTFCDSCDKAREKVKQGSMRCVVFYFDIDYFKQYNDLYGHNKGDDCLIKIVSEAEEKALSFGLKLYRIGGEEFVLMGRMKNSDWRVLQESDWFGKWTSSKWFFNEA